ncbi:hypothetical protein WG902_03720 [Ramlibacter sp. PS3R-8]|uniref:hypothetical protein n=1 Tax=Ramlibacter sp. PS3R-8 TaxID=3133437 RepID=UPI0030ABAB5F
MSVLRLVIAWLVMATLPLQGFAAASMLFCDQAAHATGSQSQPHGHDHAAHGYGEAHDHASHLHASDAGVQPDSKLSQAQGETAQAGSGTVDDGHGCPICASCCNLVALSETFTPSLDVATPMSQPLQEAARVFTRHAPTPDKPPRT